MALSLYRLSCRSFSSCTAPNRAESDSFPTTAPPLTQCGGDPTDAEFPHQLGPGDVPREVGHAGQGAHHHTQRGARPGPVHLLRQDRHADTGKARFIRGARPSAVHLRQNWYADTGKTRFIQADIFSDKSGTLTQVRLGSYEELGQVQYISDKTGTLTQVRLGSHRHRLRSKVDEPVH